MTGTDLMTRGEFLIAGAGVAMSARHRRRRHRRRDSLHSVKHVVILTQENRSFDSYFGTMAGVRGFSDPGAMRLASGKSVLHQPYLLSLTGELTPWRLDSHRFSPCALPVGNAWETMHDAWNGGRMDRWTRANGPWCMSCYTRADVPFHMALGDAFTVCDGYFCSVLGPTNPNRHMMWTGTIDPEGKGGGPAIDNTGRSYTWTTYPERLTAAGVSWRVYHQTDDFDDNTLKYFVQYQRAKPGSPLYENAMVNRPAGAFMDDVAADRLPAVSWIVAPTGSSEHPGNSAAAGADYISAVMRAFAAHPAVWRKTAFVLTYDENGGFFDHVAPPVPPAGTPGEFVGGEPIGLGFRVPAVVCSPWTRGGYVCSDTFDHTSLIRMLERRFGVREPQISAWRRRTCGDLWSCFDFSRPDYSIPALPSTAAGAVEAKRLCSSGIVALPPVLPGGPPAQEPGTKRRRG